MSAMLIGSGAERVIPFVLFALYLVTSVRICRYSSWVRAGAPNPFLPRRVRKGVSHHDIRALLKAEMRALG